MLNYSISQILYKAGILNRMLDTESGDISSAEHAINNIFEKLTFVICVRLKMVCFAG